MMTRIPGVNAMARITAIAIALLAAAAAASTAHERQSQESQEPPAASQPATTRPAVPQPARAPEQAEIIRNLLRDRGRSTAIMPQEQQSPADDTGAGTDLPLGPDGLPLLVDGTLLVERPGRLMHEGGKPMFSFIDEGAGVKLRSMEILPNQLLEAMERELQLGTTQFVISAEVTRYHDLNYLLLRKILRRVEHGNLSP